MAETVEAACNGLIIVGDPEATIGKVSTSTVSESAFNSLAAASIAKRATTP